MSKSYKKRVQEEENDDYTDYSELREKVIDRRKKRRFDRALKVRDIDSLLEEDLWGDELDGYK